MSEDDKVLHAQFEALKELLSVKLDNICQEINTMKNVLREHNGRLTMAERALEQARGAGKVFSGVWGLVGGILVAVFVYIINNHLK